MVYSRGYSTKYTYNTLSHNLDTATVTPTSTNLVAGAGSTHSFLIDTSAKIPKYGVIEIELPAGFTYQGGSVTSGFKKGTKVFAVGQKIYFKNPEFYDKVADGVINVSVHVVNSATPAATNFIIKALSEYGQDTTIFQSTQVITTTAGTGMACYITASPLSSSIGGSSAYNIEINALVETPTITGAASAGYSMIVHTSGVNSCTGVPLYTFPACTMGGTLSIGHRNIKTGTGEYNYALYVGDFGANFAFTTDHLSMDIGNHNTNLDSAIADGTRMACHVKVQGNTVKNTCFFRQGTASMSPGIKINLFANYNNNDNLEVMVAKFYNPTTTRPIELRIRHVTNTVGSL